MKELKPIATIPATGRFYQGLALSSTGLLAANGETLDIYDVAKAFHDHAPYLPKPLFSLPGTWRGKNMTWSPDGKRLAYVTAGATRLPSRAVVLDVLTGESLTHHDHYGEGNEASIECLAWSPDGNYIASATQEDQLHLWHAGTGKTVKTSSIGYPFHFLCWSPDSQRLVVKNTKKNTSTFADRAYVELWDVHNVTSWERVTCIHDADQYHLEGEHSCGTFSPDGRELALGTTMGYLQLWSCDPMLPPVKSLIRDFHQKEMMHLLWPDRRYLISVGADHHMLVWDARSWEIAYHTGSRQSLIASITCYDNYIAAVNAKGTVLFYHLPDEHSGY